MKRLVFTGILMSLSLVLAACGSTATPAPSSSKPVIKVETNPNPALMGDVELNLTITDANGNSIEGARVDVSADHTEMSGMSMGGAATEQGGGKYSIKANFSMSGTWKLTIYIRKDALDYKEEIQFPVQ
jgi:hypothetical protein